MSFISEVAIGILVTFIIVAILGVVVVFVISKWIANDRCAGDLYLDFSDPDFQTGGFRFSMSAEEMKKHKYVIIKVHSQE